MLDTLERFILQAAAQWWVLPLTAALCLLDGVLPVFPSESILVALAAIVRDGQPFPLVALGAAGAAGAFLGDQSAYWIGRTVGTQRWAWMRGARVRASIEMAQRNLREHGALLLFTARFIPGGRVAVNLTAGAIRYPWPRFAALDFVSTVLWAAFSITLARLTAAWLHNAVLQILVSVVVAGLVGLVLDRVTKALLGRPEPAVE